MHRPLLVLLYAGVAMTIDPMELPSSRKPVTEYGGLAKVTMYTGIAGFAVPFLLSAVLIFVRDSYRLDWSSQYRLEGIVLAVWPSEIMMMPLAGHATLTMNLLVLCMSAVVNAILYAIAGALTWGLFDMCRMFLRRR
jgi:hypothetical protein